MSDDTATNVPAPTGDVPATATATVESATNIGTAGVNKTKTTIAETKAAEKKSKEAVTEDKTKENTTNTAAAAKPADDVEMTDATKETVAAEPSAENEKASDAAENNQKDEGAAATVAGGQAADAADKNKSRRKSAGASGVTAKKLNKKASKAKLTHLDAQPGDYYFVKLKGHPQWPAVVCDEDMLPQTLIKTRPVTAARQDGTYREDYADGGKRANDRTFPVMYLYTNEFSWVRNTDLSPLEASTVMSAINDKMRKDLKHAYEIASHAHPLDHFKEILQSFQEELAARMQAARDALTTAKKSSKKGKTADDDEDEDMEMPTADEGEAEKPKKSKKRKAEEDAAPPQESAKKTKIKITSNSTPKTANGAATPKGSKATEQKSAKSKSKAKGKGEEKKVEVQQKEPELSAEEKLQRKEKEVLFLRHKLQKGLLSRDEEPKEEEMKAMSDYVTKLETFPDLEVDIIRNTKINKVLKTILKLGTIPREAEFKFKDRSQTLLDKWNKLLAEVPAPTNGVNGKSAEPDATKDEAETSEKTNGAKANGVTEVSSKDAKSTKTPEAADAGPEAVENAA